MLADNRQHRQITCNWFSHSFALRDDLFVPLNVYPTALVLLVLSQILCCCLAVCESCSSELELGFIVLVHS